MKRTPAKRPGYCDNCGNPIPAGRQATVKYCGQRCRNKARTHNTVRLPLSRQGQKIAALLLQAGDHGILTTPTEAEVQAVFRPRRHKEGSA